MKPKSPPARRKFTGPWDRADYLYHKVLYWLYDRGQPRKARPFAGELKALLARYDVVPGSIRCEEYRSLIHEANGDLQLAIEHREKEVRLLKRLLKLADDASQPDAIRAHHDHSDLSDRLDLLAVLYHELGNPRRAVQLLGESRDLCQRHGLPFDGQELLDHYVAEVQGLSAAPRRRRA